MQLTKTIIESSCFYARLRNGLVAATASGREVVNPNNGGTFTRRKKVYQSRTTLSGFTWKLKTLDRQVELKRRTRVQQIKTLFCLRHATQTPHIPHTALVGWL